MATIPKPFRFIPRLMKGLDMRGTSINHTIRMGQTTRGKFYHWAWESEVGVQLGKTKVWAVWCKDWSHLQEYLTFLFPSQSTNDKFKNPKFKPRKFKVRIFIPLSEKIPEYLPKNLVVPYTMSIDNLSMNVISMMVGKNEPSYYQEYESIAYDGMTFTDFRKSVRKAKYGGWTIKKGFMGVKMVELLSGTPATINHLLRRCNDFEKEGIISNMKGYF